MNAQPISKPLDHSIDVDECECYEGYDYWRPTDRSVEIAVCKLISAHQDEFQTFLYNAELERRDADRQTLGTTCANHWRTADMSELTCDVGDFWREVFARHSAPVKFCGMVLYRSRDEQVKVETKARRIADTAVRDLRAANASDKVVFAAFESVTFAIEYRQPELRVKLVDAYRDGDHAEMGRIIADLMRQELHTKAEDDAEIECDKGEPA